MIAVNIILGLMWLGVSEFNFKGKNQNKIKASESLSSFGIIQKVTILVYLYSTFNLHFEFENLTNLGLKLYPIGIFTTIVGLVIYIKAKSDLGSSFSPCADVYIPEELVTNGIYGLVRHPIYSANLAIVFGMSLSTDSIILLIIVPILYYAYSLSAKMEEKDLNENQPSYGEYMKITNRFFPAMKKKKP